MYNLLLYYLFPRKKLCILRYRPNLLKPELSSILVSYSIYFGFATFVDAAIYLARSSDARVLPQTEGENYDNLIIVYEIMYNSKDSLLIAAQLIESDVK